MKLKAYKTSNARRVLRATLVSDYLDDRTLENYRVSLDCVTIAPEMYISLFITPRYPTINLDEYFQYLEFMGIDIFSLTKAREETFPMLVAILEDKYGIEYVDAED